MNFFRLLINERKVYEGGSLITLLREMAQEAMSGNKVEIWYCARTQWRILDGGVYPFGIYQLAAPQSKIPQENK